MPAGMAGGDADTVKLYLDDPYRFTVHSATHYRNKPSNRLMHAIMVCETCE